MTTRSTEREACSRKASSGADSGWPASVTKTSSAARRQACSASRAWPPSSPPAPGVSTSTTPGSRPGATSSRTPATSASSRRGSDDPPTTTQSRIADAGTVRLVPSTKVTVAVSGSGSFSSPGFASAGASGQCSSTKTPVVMSVPVGTRSRRPSRALTSVLLPRLASPTTVITGAPGRARSRFASSSSRSERPCWRNSSREPRSASDWAAVSRTADPTRACACRSRRPAAVAAVASGVGGAAGLGAESPCGAGAPA